MVCMQSRVKYSIKIFKFDHVFMMNENIVRFLFALEQTQLKIVVQDMHSLNIRINYDS